MHEISNTNVNDFSYNTVIVGGSGTILGLRINTISGSGDVYLLGVPKNVLEGSGTLPN